MKWWDDIVLFLEERSPIAMPWPHFMGFASLDVWARMLRSASFRVHPRYWLRLAGGLFTSSLGTMLVLPERLVLQPLLRIKYRQNCGQLNHPPGVIVVLGYFRSGTTHLQYLLNCDPQMSTPKWNQVSLPHGYVLSWAFLHLFMIPFLSETRPQDNVSFGPEYPAEDDFALNNAALCSSLPGRMVFPGAWAHYRRFHDLQHLTAAERARWAFHQWAFLFKCIRVHSRQMLMLKSPSHTARVPELLHLFGPSNVRFVHIHREADAVIRSNIKMLKRFKMYHLQDNIDDQELEQRVTLEYVETEERYLATRDQIPEGQLVEVSYEQLTHQPHEAISEIYDRLGVPFGDAFAHHLEEYLQSVQDYQPNAYAANDSTSAIRAPFADRLAKIADAFEESPYAIGKTKPRSESSTQAPATAPSQSSAPRNATRGVIASLWMMIVAVAMCSLWFGLAILLDERLDWMIWLVGAVIGYAGLRANRSRGHVRLGSAAACLTVIALVGMSFPITRYVNFEGYGHVQMQHLLVPLRLELFAKSTLFWLGMGAVTAYRFGSRSRIRPGG